MGPVVPGACRVDLSDTEVLISNVQKKRYVPRPLPIADDLSQSAIIVY